MGDGWERYLTWALAALLVAAIAATVAVALSPPETTDPYTEFYLLGPEGSASGYPTGLAPGESGDVIVGISNHEDEAITYHTVVTWNGTETDRYAVTVADETTRERRVVLTAPPEPGVYRVRFLLYRGAVGGEPYRTTRLLVRVGE